MRPLELYDFTRRQLEELVTSWGFAAVHAAKLWKYLYREAVDDFGTMPDLPVRLRDRLIADARLTQIVAAQETLSDDGLTRKYLLGLPDGPRIETVLMRMRGRATACLSSQAGCPLGCVFCATGQAGFARNLSTAEIVAQALHIQRVLKGERENPSLRNIVVMGMGEPLLNYDAVMNALEILSDPSGVAIGHKQITISTVGVIPGIIRLADEARPYSLAVSLHAATQAERTVIVPAARTWPLDDLMAACRYYTARQKKRIFFEWTLIDGCNDSIDQAHALVELLRGIPAQVNIIPLNPTAGYLGEPGQNDALDRFRSVLRDHGLPVSIRQRRGIDIAAGCGQLAATAQ